MKVCTTRGLSNLGVFTFVAVRIYHWNSNNIKNSLKLHQSFKYKWFPVRVCVCVCSNTPIYLSFIRDFCTFICTKMSYAIRGLFVQHENSILCVNRADSCSLLLVEDAEVQISLSCTEICINESVASRYELMRLDTKENFKLHKWDLSYEYG